MFRNGTGGARLLNLFGGERHEHDEAFDGGGSSPGKCLFEAVIRNQLRNVKTLLEEGADPNVSLAIIRSQYNHNNSNGEQPQSKEQKVGKITTELDEVFLWKKLFGESPTLVHIAVLNVYHCNHNHRALDNALKILKLLLNHGGDVGHTSNNMFLRRKMIATNPLDLALGVQRMTLWMNIEKAETAMVKAVEIMRQHYNASTNKPFVRSHSVPFELVSLKLLDGVESLLFAPPQKRRAADITFVSSDVEYPAAVNGDDTMPFAEDAKEEKNGVDESNGKSK